MIHTATFDMLSARQLYALLRLRVDVFVVEQNCPYHELDGRDVEPETKHVWFHEDGQLLSSLRVLNDPEGWRIGRVVTAPDARGRGLAAQLMQHVLQDAPAVVVLDAQSHLAHWYERFGFTVDGAEFLEDGIPHVPMRRAASPVD